MINCMFSQELVSSFSIDNELQDNNKQKLMYIDQYLFIRNNQIIVNNNNLWVKSDSQICQSMIEKQKLLKQDMHLYMYAQKRHFKNYLSFYSERQNLSREFSGGQVSRVDIFSKLISLIGKFSKVNQNETMSRMQV